MQEETLQSQVPAHLARQFRPAKTVRELHTELQRIAKVKRDFIVPVESLRATTLWDESQSDKNGDAKKVMALTYDHGGARYERLNSLSGQQLATFTDIPSRYFQRLGEEKPDLLKDCVNHGLDTLEKNSETKARLLRSVDGRLRAFLSHRYRILDSHDLLDTILPHLVDYNFEVVSSELTERKMYLKAATPRIQGEVAKGDVVSFGIQISTSDVGCGKLNVEPFFLSLWCLNGATIKSKFSATHIERSKHESMVHEILTDETKALSDKAFFNTVRDWISHLMKPEVFHSALQKMKDATEHKIESRDLAEVIEVTSNVLKVTNKDVKKNALEALIDGASFRGLNQWALSNAFTAAAKSESLSYDESVELEAVGGKVLTLAPSAWKRISTAVKLH